MADNEEPQASEQDQEEPETEDLFQETLRAALSGRYEDDRQPRSDSDSRKC